MNEKIKQYIFIGLVCLVPLFFGFLCGNAFTAGKNNPTIDKLSADIDAGKKINFELSERNKIIGEQNILAQRRIDELSERIRSDDIGHQKKLVDITNSLGQISDGLGNSGNTIQSVIDGLEKIKGLIREIETVQ